MTINQWRGDSNVDFRTGRPSTPHRSRWPTRRTATANRARRRSSSEATTTSCIRRGGSRSTATTRSRATTASLAVRPIKISRRPTLNLTHAGLGPVFRIGRDGVRAAGAGADRRALPVAADRHCADLADDAALVDLLRLSIHHARARRACPPLRSCHTTTKLPALLIRINWTLFCIIYTLPVVALKMAYILPAISYR